MFVCQFCQRSFSRKDNLKRHGDCRIATASICGQCGGIFNSEGTLQRHLKKKHAVPRAPKRKAEDPACPVATRGGTDQNSQISSSSTTPPSGLIKHARLDSFIKPSTSSTRYCHDCGLEASINGWVNHLQSLQHLANTCVEQEEDVKLIKTSFKYRIATYRLSSEQHPTSIKEFLKRFQEKFIKLVGDMAIKYGHIKVGVELFGRFLLPVKEIEEVKSFNAKFRLVSGGTDLEELFGQFLVILDKKCSEFQEKESGLYTNELSEAHETIPIKVKENGEHLSHNLTHHYSDFDEPLRFNITIFEHDHHLILNPSNTFLAPNVLIEWRRQNRHVRKKPKNNFCHYQGFVHGDSLSMVAISACNGLAGMIQTKNGKYYVEPAYQPNKSINPGHKHLIFKRSAVINSMPEPIATKKKRKKKRKKYENQSSCGTREPKKYTEIEWQKQLGKVRVQERKHKNNKSHNKIKIPNVNQSQLRKLKYKHVNSLRQRRSVSQPHFVETAIVADASMVEFHQDGDIETYILTLMNMVSAFYQDPSIGNYIKIAVVKIILLDDSSVEPEFNSTTNADITLKNFCKWQKDLNPKDDSHPHHHDVAILLTRKDICAKSDQPCGTLGVAHIGGMCKVTRSCSVNEDNGITSAHTIAHEMGHNFGMLHDTEKIGCKRKVGNKLHIMAPALEADAIQAIWSNCSRREVTNFLDKGLGKCLQDKPEPIEEYQYPDLPAGAMYNANYQCRFQFNTVDATVCSPLDEICSRLWCSINDSCTTLLRPAAPGTNCGKHKWCQDQKCVPIMDPPTPIDGGWGEWSSWSECSRTCGSGVSIMSRECDHPMPTDGGKFCVGERKRYRICNTDPCPEGEPTYRALQCSWYNNKTYEGKLYEWQPYFDQADPCQLYCSDANETLIVPWGDYAADGTPCNVVSRDVCISGICKQVGCDWVVDSTAKEDECGICQGDGTKCDIIAGEYKKQSNYAGYREIVVIPRGARNIRVAENDQSENYIGIENALVKKSYLNGKRHITLPGEYNVAGAQALYERDHNLEKIRIPGPIQEPILVSIYFRGKVYNPGVTWKYSIWKPEVTKQVKYTWIMEEWSQCSATCGGGTQHKQPLCQESTVSPVASDLETPNIVAEEMCDDMTRPEKMVRTCNDDPCPYKWWVGPWQACPVTCYDGGKKPMRRRSVMCVDLTETALPDQYCDRGAKPHEYEPCRRLLPCEAYE